MDSAACRIVKNFITDEEADRIVSWIGTLDHGDKDSNHHLTELSKELNGRSYIFDISNTPLTNYITKFQAVYGVSHDRLPDFILGILDRISEEFGFPKEHLFLQAVDMDKGGRINPHYDAAVEGYVNYKCNVSVLSEDYGFHVDRETYNIGSKDLYGFEASLYRHWTEEFNSRRIFLSCGFMVPYERLGRTVADPRVRLSRRIEKHFQ